MQSAITGNGNYSSRLELTLKKTREITLSELN